MKKISPNFLIFIILILSILAPFGIDEFTPSLPFMVKSLHTTSTSVQLTITFYLMGMAISQLFLGPISDKIGRRSVLLFTIPIFFLGSVFCIYANFAYILWIGRALQGIGLGGIAFIPAAMASESFTGKKFHQVTSYLIIIFSVVTLISPVVGGHLQDSFGWRSNFIFLLILSILIYLFILFFSPETHQPKEHHKLSFFKFFLIFFDLLKNKTFVCSSICSFITWIYAILFSMIAPFIFESTLKYSATQYGYIALIIGGGFIIGSYLNLFFIKFFKPKSIIIASMIMAFFFSLALTFISMLNIINVFSVLIPVFLVILTCGIVYPRIMSLALKSNPKYVGIVASFYGVFLLAGNSLVTFYRIYFPSTFTYCACGNLYLFSSDQS